MKRILKSRIFLVIVTAILVSIITVYATETLTSSDIVFDNTGTDLTSTNVHDAIAELYDKASGASSGCDCGGDEYCGCVSISVPKGDFKARILADNPTIKTNPTLTSASSTNGESGFYKMSVTNGFGGTTETADTYYFRGNVTNNVVEFAGLIWRIVRINEDGTIRLILDSGISNNSAYTFNSSYSNYTSMYYLNSSAKNGVNSWFSTAITGTNAEKVATGNYFCEAAKVKNSNTSSGGYSEMKIYSSYTPMLDCTADGNGKRYVNESAGLLTYDEAVLAGEYNDVTNQSNYLYKNASGGNNDFSWWIMSPAGINTSNYVQEWLIIYGRLGSASTHTSNVVRPVINLKSDVLVTKDTTTGHYIVQ